MKSELSVDLNKIYNPHPEILRRFKDANSMDLFWPHRSEYINEERIFLNAKSSGSEIKHKIIGIYRKKVGSKEYCFFHNAMMTKDYFKNTVTWCRLVGRYEAPTIVTPYGLAISSMRNNMNPEKLQPAPMPSEIESYELVYEFEFSKLKPQLIKWREQNIIDENTKLYVWVDDTKYSKPYTWDEWLSLDINDLVLLGKYGKKFDSVLGKDMGTAEILQALRNTLKEELLSSTVKSSK